MERAERPALSFGEFLAALIKALGEAGINPCVLRNYEGFPGANLGSDLDLLVSPAELPRAVRALSSIQGTRIVGYFERRSVAHVFLAGVSSEPEARALQVDLDMRLPWKGLLFLRTDAVLKAAIPRAAGLSTFYSPSPAHEAIISLLMSLLLGGYVKEKYFAKVQRTFASDRSEVIQALLPHFGPKTSTQLVDRVLGGDRRKILGCVGSLRYSLAVHSFLRRPIGSVSDVIRHYASGFASRYSSKTLETICIIGPDDSYKKQIAQSLIAMLQFTASEIESFNAGPRSQTGLEPREVAQSPHSGAGVSPGSRLSMAQAAMWFVEEWLSRFKQRRSLTLRISEDNLHGLSIDPQRYGYDGPMWFLGLLQRLTPSPDLWILLDPVSEGTRSNAERIQPGRTWARLEAYRAFVKTRKRYVVLDAGVSADRVAEDAYAAIIETLAERADRGLTRRFRSMPRT